ncbi:hypothetical protein RB620_26620 [Paenibacillus sp. LHD-117]|uniref:hypothetical protein n=1 Tax=Paenibacillus sp. LHD-117 TaxID=3071412 RepID=UPI0027E010DE|nr:hypothetical protein [Paenibacillus sp. LHD-117]MDQ6423007.1 hypothetical protein [Paenibacillus sp. LHD-117]
MEEQQICPWCLTEITWDEEIGPESHCPHCENELGGYRTMSIGLDGGKERGGYDSEEEDDEDMEEWNDTGADDSEADWASEQEGYRGASSGMLAAEGVIQRVIDEQDEAPECPNCREYMMEAGTQTVGGEGFVPAVPKAIGTPLLPNPFRMVWYVCPSCFTVSSQLAFGDREALIEKMSEAE